MKHIIKLSDFISEKIDTTDLLLIRDGYVDEEQQGCETSTCTHMGCLVFAEENSSCRDYSCYLYS